jgi:PD-(D/E)XK nuclease superfamily
VAAKYFSVSDVMTFLQCREKWDTSSPNRQSLRHRATPRMYLTQGTALHAAIEAQEKGVQTPSGAADDYLFEERKARVAQITRETGFEPWPVEMKEWDEKADLTRKLVQQYFDYYGHANPLADQGLKYIATEVPFKVDISDLVHIDDAYFVGTFDGIAVDTQDQLFLVENKSYTQKPDLQDLQVHFQTTGYAVAWQMLTNTRLTGALYNGVAKKLIKAPRRLKDGSLSADVSQQTTYDRFTSEMKRSGVALSTPKYAKILGKLKEIENQGDTRFFYRERFYYNDTQIENWTEEFIKIVRGMANDPDIYRTVPYNGCGPQGADCWWRDVCFAKHTGQDVDLLIEQRYDKGSYGTIEAVDGVEPFMVGSVAELREVLQAHV